MLAASACLRVISGVCWWNCLGTSKGVADTLGCPGAGWIDDRHVSTHEDHGSKLMFPLNVHFWP